MACALEPKTANRDERGQTDGGDHAKNPESLLPTSTISRILVGGDGLEPPTLSV